MAVLPSNVYAIQMIGDDTVILFDKLTEREIVRFSAADKGEVAGAQKIIFESELDSEDRVFAHFWSGYFYAHARLNHDQDARG